MSDRLKGKRAFVTAAAAGIGRASAIAFAREGASVFATDIDEKALASLAAEGVKEVARLDARDTSAVAALAKRVGGIDILLNAAGFVHHGTVLDCSDEDWDFSFDLNVKSMHRTIRSFLPGMLERGRGSIVNISSAAGVFKAAPNRYVYGATKAAVAALTRAVAADFITKGIRCNCICPGTIETPSMLNRAAAAGPAGREMFVSRQTDGISSARRRKLLCSRSIYASDESAFTPPAWPTSSMAAGRCNLYLAPRLRGRGRICPGDPGEGKWHRERDLIESAEMAPHPSPLPAKPGRGSRPPTPKKRAHLN